MLPWNVEDLTFDEARFTGDVRLFPLPDLVMFPHVFQPLHVFERRYRDLLNDALDGDGLIAMSVLAPGWETDYEGRPAVLPHVCVGKVVTHHRLDDGRYNLMLLGMRRGRIIAERPATRSFRQAEVVILEDEYSDVGEADREGVRLQLAKAFQRMLPVAPEAKCEGAPQELVFSDTALGLLTDVASFSLPFNRKLKIQLLGEVDVDRRARLLLDAMGEPLSQSPAVPGVKKSLRYPPRFSAN